MDRRQFLLAGLAGMTTGVAGCTNSSDYPSVDDAEQVSELPRPTRGEDNAPVHIQVFEDYKCPHCAAFKLNIFPKIKQDYIDSGDARYEAWDFPIPVSDPESYYFANSARYVQDTTGDGDEYWSFKDYIYNNQSSLTVDTLDARAAKHGGTKEEAAHARRGVYHPVIMSDRERGSEMGVNATPGIFINGTHFNNEIDGSITYDKIANAIENEL